MPGLQLILKRSQRIKGFSLIEILVVISIIAIISGVVALSVTSVQQNTRNSQRKSDLRVLQSAIQQFYADKNHYPNNDINSLIQAGSALKNCSGEPTGCTESKTYLSKMPVDPSSSSTNYCYKSQFTAIDATACNSTTNPGKCHFYKLYAQLENPSGTTTFTCNGVTTYNFEITPL